MQWLSTSETIQIISSTVGFALTISSGILRLLEMITKEQFYNLSFVSIILMILVPFFIEYALRD
jgi:hypothetical protein